MTGALYTFTVRRQLKQDRAMVFGAFSEAKFFAKWFKPSEEVSVEVLSFKFVEGGQYRLRYTMLDGRNPVLFGDYELIAPFDKLVFSWCWEQPDPHAGVSSRVSIELLQHDSSTEIVVTQEGTRSKELVEGRVVGWEGALDCLERLLSHSPEEANNLDQTLETSR